VAETLLRLVSNQTPSEQEVGRGRGGEISSALRASSTWGQSVRAQFGLGGGARNRGASKHRTMGR